MEAGHKKRPDCWDVGFVSWGSERAEGRNGALHDHGRVGQRCSSCRDAVCNGGLFAGDVLPLSISAQDGQRPTSPLFHCSCPRIPPTPPVGPPAAPRRSRAQCSHIRGSLCHARSSDRHRVDGVGAWSRCMPPEGVGVGCGLQSSSNVMILQVVAAVGFA